MEAEKAKKSRGRQMLTDSAVQVSVGRGADIVGPPPFSRRAVFGGTLVWSRPWAFHILVESSYA